MLPITHPIAISSAKLLLSMISMKSMMRRTVREDALTRLVSVQLHVKITQLILKVMMVDELEFDEVVTCDHSYDQRCHTSYVTSFVSQQQEECSENFRKV